MCFYNLLYFHAKYLNLIGHETFEKTCFPVGIKTTPPPFPGVVVCMYLEAMRNINGWYYEKLSQNDPCMVNESSL